MVKSFVVGLLACLGFVTMQAQTFTPMGPVPGRPLVPTPVCSPEPTLAQITNVSFKSRITDMSTSEAASLKITFVGSATGSFNANDRVIVDDQFRGLECTATDGHTRLLYGQTMRTTAITSQLKVEGGVTFAIVAANATITRQASSIEVETLGLPQSVQVKMLEVKAAAASGLTVENYGEFIKKLKEANQLAITDGGQGSVQRIGIIADLADDDLVKALATAFSLQRIKDGRDCNNAINAFKTKSTVASNAIHSTYDSVAHGCDASASAVKDKARSLLNGIEVAQN